MALKWVQLYHFLVGLYEGDVLESITSHIGRLLKLDKLMVLLNWAKFAQINAKMDQS